MEDETEYLVLHRWEKTKVAINNPFKSGSVSILCYFRGVDRRLTPQPCNVVTCSVEDFSVTFGRSRDTLLSIVKEIDIRRKSICARIKRRRTGHVASRIASLGNDAQNFALDLR
jgi:hypothetical protein